MNTEKTTNKDIYYTKEHEWIDFQGTVAYIGVCGFKLIGFKAIHQISYREPSGFKKKGDIIATIKYNEYHIEVHMPVDGKVVEINDTLLSGDQNVLLQHSENSGWLALIVPAQPYERTDLLLPKQYQMIGKGKYAK